MSKTLKQILLRMSLKGIRLVIFFLSNFTSKMVFFNDLIIKYELGYYIYILILLSIRTNLGTLHS